MAEAQAHSRDHAREQAAGRAAREGLPGLFLLRRPVPVLAALVVGAHLLVNFITPYSVHRDELLYLAMGRHLRLFRMDFPPFIALLANASRSLGDSLVAIRLGPALAHGVLIILTAQLARRFGGRRFAQLLAAGCVALAPLFLRAASLFQPVVFDQLWWTLGLLVLANIPEHPTADTDAQGGGTGWGDAGPQGQAVPAVEKGTASSAAATGGAPPAERAPRTARSRWLLLGAVLGIGLLTKFSIAFIGLGIVAGVALTRLRRWLLTPWPYLAALLACLLGGPSLAGQVTLGFPFLGQMSDLAATQLQRVGPGEFLLGQLMIIGLPSLLALAGVVTLIVRRDTGGRAVAWSCVIAFGVLLALHGKAYYAGPVYPALIAAGAAAFATGTAALRRGVRVMVRGVVVLACVLLPLLLLPMGLPFLPPAAMAAYAHRLGIAEATTTNTGEVLELPQDYADMLGWEAQAAAVARVYHALPGEDRARTVIVADNYGEAGAIDFFGPRYGLPQAVAPTGSYWYFGPGRLPGELVIKVRGRRDDLLHYFRSVELVAVVNEPWVVPEERNVQIWVCRGPYRTLQEIWPMFEGRN